MRYLLILLASLTLTVVACQNSEKEAAQTATASAPTNEPVDIDKSNISESVTKLIDNNEFGRALNYLKNQEAQGKDVSLEKQRVHLNYGLGLVNMTVTTMAGTGKSPAGGMAVNMYAALREFNNTIMINDSNEAAQIAKQQIQNIMQVYSTMPDRMDKIPAGIKDTLKLIGFNY